MTNYARMYRLGFTPWERYGPAAGAQLRSWLEREAEERPDPPGRALDIGCGRGQFTPELARHSWEATGLDFVPAAIDAARERSPEVPFVVGDATNLSPDLGKFDLFVDIGCFQGFDPAQQKAEGRSVTARANPGATLLMLAFGPSIYRRMVEGVSREEVEAAFHEWELIDVEAAATEGLGFPMNRTNPQWYRFRRTTS